MNSSLTKRFLLTLTSLLMISLTGCGAPNLNDPFQLSADHALSPIADSTSNSLHTAKQAKYELAVMHQSMEPLQTKKQNVIDLSIGSAGPNALWLNEALATLHDLPLSFYAQGALSTTNNATAQTFSALAKQDIHQAFHPLKGTWTWNAVYPSTLVQLWNPKMVNVITQGAVMAFEHQHGLAVDGIAGPQVETALIHDLSQQRLNSIPYTYVTVYKTSPEKLAVWENGQIVFTSLANTGISASPTPNGTWPVYERLVSQTMKGKTPTGAEYRDPGVPWINYFYNGCAIHGFPRAAYGFPQSLGCVELPISSAKTVYNLLQYGTLVTVTS